MSSEDNMANEVGSGSYLFELGEPALDFTLWAMGAWRDSFSQQIGFEPLLCVILGA